MLSQEERSAMEANLCTARGRKDVIAKSYTKTSEDDWQNVPTPYDIAGEMVDLVPDATHYAVLFSIEFLEVLVKERGVDPSRIAFFADTDREMRMARHSQMYGVHAFRLYKNRILTPTGFDGDELALEINEGIKSIWREEDMKFNKLAVVMNPPYQESDGGHSRSATPVYNKFIETVIDNVCPNYLVSIQPSRWMSGAKGRHLATLDKFRERMVADRCVQKIVHFPGSTEVFPSVSVNGGVNYFLWAKDYNGFCEFVVGNTSTVRQLDEFDMIVMDNGALSILRKVTSESNVRISRRTMYNLFGLRTNFSSWTDSGVKCYIRGGRTKYCAAESVVDRKQIIGLWKVAIVMANGAAQVEDDNGYKRVLSSPTLIEPGAVCTETYLVVNTFDNKIEADNFVSYMRTKFFRFLLGIKVTTQHFGADKFAFVPDLGDYSSPWTDEELYDKFKLTRQERAYIESKIKPLKGD